MKITTLYVDTSVIGGCCDPEFQVWSLLLLKAIQTGKFHLALSDLVAAELQAAPLAVQEAAGWFWEAASHVLSFSQEAASLADEYLSHGILPRKYRDDARHIAIATVAAIDLVVSWNFRHIVQFRKIQLFNAVNIELGYKPILIHSPREVVHEDR